MPDAATTSRLVATSELLKTNQRVPGRHWRLRRRHAL